MNVQLAYTFSSTAKWLKIITDMCRIANRNISCTIYEQLTGVRPTDSMTLETINKVISEKINSSRDETERNYLSLVIETVNSLPETLDFLTTRKMQNMYRRFLGEINETIHKYQTYLTDDDNL